MSAKNGSTKGKSEFGTVEKVQQAIATMQKVEQQRAFDRARINTLFNGGRPYSAEEEKKFQIAINVNFGAGKRIMLDANRQVNNALLHPGVLFTASTDSGRVDKRDEWGQIFTTEIHKPLQMGKSGKRNMFLIKNRNASVCMHGIGPLLWPNDFRWMPRFVPLEDLLIPTDTYCDFSNLRYFGVNLYLSPGEFTDMTQGDMVQKGWNKKACAKILDDLSVQPPESQPSSWQDQPEAQREIFKQNQGYYYSDAITKIKLRAFYFQEIDDPQKWYRRVIMRESYDDMKVDEFLYTSDEPFADDIDQILNCQYGDLSLVAPNKYHSVRGLGVDLYAPFEITNRMQCEFAQATFEHLKMYFRIQNPADRDRLKNVVLQQFGFIPEGLSIVGRQERHQVDPNMVEMVLSQMRQYMQENSAAFVQDQQKQSGNPITAREATIRLNQANMMVSAMLGSMYVQEGFYYEELKRRFLKPDSHDKEVKAFQKRCLAKGIPKEMLQAEKWRVTPERVLGGGDQTLADAQAQWLYENRTAYGPEAQHKIMFTATSTILRDPSKARNLVPEAPATSSKGSQMAESLFGTLMDGVQCSMREGIDYEGYIGKLLMSTDATIKRIEQSGNMATLEEIIGLGTVLQNIGQYLAVMAEDDAKKQLVKQIQDVIGQQTNLIKGFAQRLQEQQSQSQIDPETMAKTQAIIATTQAKIQSLEATTAAKLQSKAATDAQKLAQKDAAFIQKSRQGLTSHALKSQQTMAQTKQDIATKQALTITDIAAKKAQADAAPKSSED